MASTTRVVVDFYADWCPPCRAIAPIFSELADKYSSAGRLAFVKVNVDHVNDVAGRYGVSAMPTFLWFEDGVPTGVALEGIKPSASVNVNNAGLITMIRGADRSALRAVVEGLASR